MGFSEIFTSSLRVVETGEKREREGARAKKGRDIGWGGVVPWGWTGKRRDRETNREGGLERGGLKG